MISVRVFVDHNYKDLKHFWTSQDFAQNMKIWNAPIALLYKPPNCFIMCMLSSFEWAYPHLMAKFVQTRPIPAYWWVLSKAGAMYSSLSVVILFLFSSFFPSSHLCVWVSAPSIAKKNSSLLHLAVQRGHTSVFYAFVHIYILDAFLFSRARLNTGVCYIFYVQLYHFASLYDAVSHIYSPPAINASFLVCILSLSSLDFKFLSWHLWILSSISLSASLSTFSIPYSTL